VTTIAIHFVPGLVPEVCTQRIAETLRTRAVKFETTHLFPDADDPGLLAIYTVKVQGCDVHATCSALETVKDVKAVQVSPERSLA